MSGKVKINNYIIQSMKALLASGDLTQIQIESFRKLLGVQKVANALFITTAAVPYGLSPKPEWLERSLRDMVQFADSFDETSLEEDGLIPEDLSKYGFVFVTGGNCFYLAYRLQETGFAAKLQNYIKQGGVYVGSSAGALILAHNIKHFVTADNPDIVPEIRDGLSVVDFVIIPHANNLKYEQIMNKIADKYKQDGQEVIMLNDDQVLFIEGDQRKVV